MSTPYRVYIGDLKGNEIIDPVTKRPRYIFFPDVEFFCNEAQVLDYCKRHFRNVTPLRVVQTGEQPLIVTPIPPEWHAFGTNRMKAEIEAGFRPYSEYILPPLDFESPIPKERKSFFRKR